MSRTVLFIGGPGRNGSTLLDLLLGRLDGFVSVGELRFLWERGLIENRLCGCGAALRSCPFWSEVLQLGFGDRGAADARKMLALQRRLERKACVPAVALGQGSPTFRRDLREYRAVLSRLYRAICDVSGATVVVDSSKYPPHGLILSELEDLDLRTIDLVRDPRAVAFSWRRRKRLVEVHWEARDMAVRHPAVAARGWLLSKALMRVLGRHARSQLTLRYEDFVTEPIDAIRNIVAGWADVSVDSSIFEARESSHTVSGNPIRHESGPIVLKPDLAWQRELSRADFATVTAMTWPLLLAYGYPLLRPRANVAASPSP